MIYIKRDYKKTMEKIENEVNKISSKKTKFDFYKIMDLMQDDKLSDEQKDQIINDYAPTKLLKSVLIQMKQTPIQGLKDEDIYH